MVLFCAVLLLLIGTFAGVLLYNALDIRRANRADAARARYLQQVRRA